MAKGIENRARSPPAVFDFATSQIQKHGGTKMYYDLVESGKRIKALRKEHGLTQEQLAEQLGVAANTIARIETGNRGISIDLAIELVVRFETTLDYIFLGREQPQNYTYEAIKTCMRNRYNLDTAKENRLLDP